MNLPNCHFRSDWELIEAITFVRELEKIATDKSLNAHVALGGGVLHRGFSSKDIDVFVYPHHTDQAFDPEKILKEFGVQDTLQCKGYRSDERDDKDVWIGSVKGGKRADFFFLS